MHPRDFHEICVHYKEMKRMAMKKETDGKFNFDLNKSGTHGQFKKEGTQEHYE